MNVSPRNGLICAAAAAVATVAALGIATPAHAAPRVAPAARATPTAQGASVSTSAAAFTPFLTSADSQITQIVQCGSLMYAVGSFTQIGLPNGTRYARSNAFSFSATTGAVTSWHPVVNGTVHTVTLTAKCGAVFLGGAFTSVNGTPRTNLAAVHSATGVVYPGFVPQPAAEVFSLALTGAQLLVGGEFKSIGGGSRTALASVSSSTGKLTSYANLGITGTIPGNSGKTRVFEMRVSPNAKRVLAMGSFKTVGGQTRLQAFIGDLGTSAMSLDAWYAPDLSLACSADEPYYVRAGTWSPDSSRVYFATTGDRGASPLCDAASAFASTSSSHQAPLWLNKTGCDSLYAVAADSSTVYIGGHERWANNSLGCDAAGPGAVSRPGMGALSPTTGLAAAWDPTRDRGEGADDELRTTAGLWIASDNFFGAVHCAGASHPGICFLPNG